MATAAMTTISMFDFECFGDRGKRVDLEELFGVRNWSFDVESIISGGLRVRAFDLRIKNWGSA